MTAAEQPPIPATTGIREVNLTAFVTSDGREFMMRSDAEAHEAKLAYTGLVDGFVTFSGKQGRDATRLRNALLAYEGWRAQLQLPF